MIKRAVGSAVVAMILIQLSGCATAVGYRVGRNIESSHHQTRDPQSISSADIGRDLRITMDEGALCAGKLEVVLKEAGDTSLVIVRRGASRGGWADEALRDTIALACVEEVEVSTETGALAFTGMMAGAAVDIALWSAFGDYVGYYAAALLEPLF